MGEGDLIGEGLFLRALVFPFFFLGGLVGFGGGTLATLGGILTSGIELTIVFARLRTGAKLMLKLAEAIPVLMWRCKGSYLYSLGFFTVGGGESAFFLRL